MRWICLSLVLALASPAAADDSEVTSYRAWTITADGLSTAAALGGIWAVHEDNTPAANVLITAAALGFLATPIIHATRGHLERAAASAWLLRGTFASIGMLTGVAIEGRCHELFCELDAGFLGAFGGIVVAAAIDSAFLTDEVRPRWSPQVAASREGARIGIALSF